MGGISLIREDNVFKGLSDAMIDQRFNWCARCEVFGLHTQDAAGNAICPEQWVGPRPTFNAGGMMGPLQCTFEGCPAGNDGEQLDSRVRSELPTGPEVQLVRSRLRDDPLLSQGAWPLQPR